MTNMENTTVMNILKWHREGDNMTKEYKAKITYCIKPEHPDFKLLSGKLVRNMSLKIFIGLLTTIQKKMQLNILSTT